MVITREIQNIENHSGWEMPQKPPRQKDPMPTIQNLELISVNIKHVLLSKFAGYFLNQRASI